VEGGEVGQLEALVEDEGRLDSAVGQEEAAVELGQGDPAASRGGLLRMLDHFQ
jgi:hypothetical protein